MLRHTLLTSTLLATAALAGPALAQTGGAPVTQLDEIVVTGEKTSRSLQDTTTSVAVTTAQRIEDENILTLQDVYNRTANVSETYGSAGFTIRGVAAQGVSGAGDAPLTTVYVDGAPLPTGILFNGPTDTWDMSQIEILRGPQSTLQGLNALAGAVVLRSRDPGAVWEGSARLIVADPSETAAAAAVGGPLVDGELGLRMAIEQRTGDGFIHNVTRDVPEDPVDRLTFRGKLLWTPSAIPGLEARLGLTHFRSTGAYPFTYVRTDVPDFYDNRISVANDPNDSDVTADIVGLEVSYPLSDRLELTSATSWSEVEELQRYDNDGTATPGEAGFSDRAYETLTQEVRVNYRGERLRGLVGAFYYNRDQQSLTGSRIDVPTPIETIEGLLVGSGFDAPTAAYVAGLYAAALPAIPVDYTGEVPSEVETYALFADGEWDLTDRLSIVAGFRWDHEENQVTVDQQAAFIGTYPDPDDFGAPFSPLWLAVAGINQGVAGLVAQAGSSAPPSHRSFDAFLPKLGVRYDLTDQITAGFVVQRGYRSGGSSVNTARSEVFAYDPEYTWNYEASLRSTWLDGAVTLNANVYYVDWTDQQVSVNFGLNLYDYHTVNAGRSHLYGFEIEGAWRVSPDLDVYGSVGHASTEFDEFEVSLGNSSDLSGTEFIYAPDLTLAAGVNYRWASGFVANLNASYRSAVFSEAGAFQADSEVGARTLVNARFGYDAGAWGAYVYGENLFDEAYMSYNRESWNQAVLGDPRVIGVLLQVDW